MLSLIACNVQANDLGYSLRNDIQFGDTPEEVIEKEDLDIAEDEEISGDAKLVASILGPWDEKISHIVKRS